MLQINFWVSHHLHLLLAGGAKLLGEGVVERGNGWGQEGWGKGVR